MKQDGPRGVIRPSPTASDGVDADTMARIKAQPNRSLALDIEELLRGEFHPLPLKGTRVLQAICQAMKDALLRGESIAIEGFGIFRVVERTPKRTSQFFLTNNPALGRSATILAHHRRRYVIFEPSMVLMAMLNLQSPNYKERRAQRRWGLHA